MALLIRMSEFLRDGVLLVVRMRMILIAESELFTPGNLPFSFSWAMRKYVFCSDAQRMSETEQHEIHRNVIGRFAFESRHVSILFIGINLHSMLY
jgi:hypothetical protein